VLVALTALLSMCASLIARVNCPTWLLLVLCGVSQQVLHLAFEGLSATFSGVVPSQHQHGTAAWEAGQLAAGHSVMPGHALELMVDTHVAAALMTAVLVAKADTAVTRGLALLRGPGSGSPPAADSGCSQQDRDRGSGPQRDIRVPATRLGKARARCNPCAEDPRV
jgi:hypothetical protein